MGDYKHEMDRAVDLLLADSRTVFVGQNLFGRSGMTGTLARVPASRKIELPVFEDTQMGMCIGLALEGFVPICYFPRFNFLLLATNQLINHLDRLPELGVKPFRAKVIIRVAVGSQAPFAPVPQLSDNFTEEYRSMLRNVQVIDLNAPEVVFPSYQRALQSDDSYLLVEHYDLYGGR